MTNPNLLQAIEEDLRKKNRPDSHRSGGQKNAEIHQEKSYQIEEISQTENQPFSGHDSRHSRGSDRSDRHGGDDDRSIDSGTGEAVEHGSHGGQE